jgi:hypothetical protein
MFQFHPIIAAALAESGQPAASRVYDMDGKAFYFFIIQQGGDRYLGIRT